jgi:hypothetical protein
MQMVHMLKDAYPEQICAALRDEFRRIDASSRRGRVRLAERRREWRAALRSRRSRRVAAHG